MLTSCVHPCGGVRVRPEVPGWGATHGERRVQTGQGKRTSHHLHRWNRCHSNQEIWCPDWRFVPSVIHVMWYSIIESYLSKGASNSKYISISFHSTSFYGFIIVLPSIAELDWFGKTRILIQYSCLIAPLHSYMNQHCKEPVYSFKTLEGRSPIGYYSVLFNMITSSF